MMRNTLMTRVIPFLPQLGRSWKKIDCRLCSSERIKSGKRSNNINSDKKLSDQYAPSPLSSTEIPTDNSGDSSPTISMSSKYVSFNERDAPVILDVEEERIAAQQATVPKDPLEDIFARISMARGEEGVFDLHELVEVLNLSRARQICVLSLPKEARYADYMCIVTGKSNRHMLAMAEFVRRVYKQKRNQGEPVPKIEGKTCKSWMALDLGNIVLHIFDESAREMYDLENLWAVGPEFDPNCHKQEDSIVSLLQRHSYVLDNLHPVD